MPGQADAPQTMTELIRTIEQRIDVVQDQINAAIADGVDTAELKTQLGILEAQLQAVKADQAAQTATRPAAKKV